MTGFLMFEPTLVVMITATFVFAGTVKGVTGTGLPTTATGILGSFISSVAAVAMLLLPSLMNDLFQFSGGGNTCQLLKRLRPMLLTVAMVTLLASTWVTGDDTTRTQSAFGVTLVAYAIWTLAGKKIAAAPQREKMYPFVIGFVTDLLTGGTGVSAMSAVPWIQSLGLEKDEPVQVLGVSFISSTLALALGPRWHNALSIQSLSLSALTIVPALIGQWIGARVRKVISPLVLKRCLLFCLIGLGTETILRVV